LRAAAIASRIAVPPVGAKPMLSALAFLLALLTGISAAAWGVLAEMEQEFARTLTVQVQKLRLLDGMFAAVLERQAHVRDMLIVKDAFERDELIQKHSELAGDFIRLRREYYDLATSPGEVAWRERFEEATAQGYFAQSELIGLLLEGDERPAREVFNSTVRRVLERAVLLLAEQRQQVALRVNETEAAAKQRMARARVLIGVFYLAALLLGVAVGWSAWRAQRRQQQQLEWQAGHDALTDLPNRRLFQRAMDEAYTERHGHLLRHTLLYVDLDQFKVVNDTAGHAAGDELLRQVARLLSGAMPPDAFIARLGGDEFGVLLRGGREAAEILAREILHALRGYRFLWEGRDFGLGASIGITEIQPGESPQEALSHADVACYAAKETGRNRFRVYQAGDTATGARLGQMQQAVQLREILELNRLELYCQPLYALDPACRQPLRFEVLARARNASGRLILPKEFIPAAERYGLSAPLDMRVFDLVHEHLRQDVRGDSCYSINLSGQSLNSREVLKHIVQALDRREIEPGRLCFEVTETAAVENAGAATRFIGVLRGMGCAFALDDFGSGMSSFGYLDKLPVDYLKMDASLVEAASREPAKRAIIGALVEVARAYRIKTVAEGVEDAALAPILRDLGVDFLQGYAFGSPGPMAPLREAA
jgi:diguanylate cyclase (GGDEF)-like protein